MQIEKVVDTGSQSSGWPPEKRLMESSKIHQVNTEDKNSMEHMSVLYMEIIISGVMVLERENLRAWLGFHEVLMARPHEGDDPRAPCDGPHEAQ